MASKNIAKEIDSRIDVEKLIIEIQNRPPIWDMTSDDYSDRIKRQKCWEELTEIFGFGSELTVEEKKQLGDLLHKKWKNIRDRYMRDKDARKGKSGDGVKKRTPYIYSNQLEFLRDTVTPKQTVNSLQLSSAAPTLEGELEESEEQEGDEVDEFTETASVSSSGSSSTRRRITQVGKKRLHPVEEKILQSLDRYDKRAALNNAKAKVDDDNRYFLLSLHPQLSSLPRHLNTQCRIEIMQCLNKYENMNFQNQQPSTAHSYSNYQQQNPPNYQQNLHPQMYPTQFQVAAQHYQRRTSETTMPAPSPTESVASYISNFAPDIDSQMK